LLPERDRRANRVISVRDELKFLYKIAVNDLGMGHLDYFNRNYESLMGEPLPTN